MPGGMPRLRMDAVSFRYRDGRRRGVHGVDVALQPGEWIAVVGANGSGKSTFLRLAAGLLRPDHGKVWWEGREAGPSAVGSGVGFLSQHPEEHVIGLTVWEDVAFGPIQQGLRGPSLEARVFGALEAVGLASRAAAEVNSLSGGELQRTALAGVLALEPRLILLDEPTAHADPQMRRLIRRSVRRLQEELNATVVWATHRPEEILAADRVLVFHEGELVYDGTPGGLKGEHARKWGIAPLDSSSKRAIWREEERGATSKDKTGPCLLEFQGVGFSYRSGETERRVLRGVSLRLTRGEMAFLTGESGAGKSTLLHIAGLLLRHQSGRLVVLGEEIPPSLKVPTRAERSRFTRLERRLRPDVVAVLQAPERQFFCTTIEDEFRLSLRRAGVTPAEWPRRTEEALSAVGLDAAEILPCSPYSLSGGERRRVAIALGMATRPKLLLLDEPTAGLDYPSGAQVLAAVDGIRRAKGCAVLVTTHDVDNMAGRCFRWFHVERGKVEERDCGHPGAVLPVLEDRPILPAKRVSADADAEVAAPWLKRVEPRLRFLGTLALAVAVAFVPPGWGLAVAGTVVAALLALAQYPFARVLATAKGLAPFLAAAVLFAAIEWTDGGPLFSRSGFYEGLGVSTRVFLMVVGVAWLPWVGGIGEMLRVLRSVVTPLRRIGLPWESLTTATLVGMRMIPVLREEARNLRLAQAARGLQFEDGVRGRWTGLASLVIPLTAAVLRRAERLGEALQMRGFVGEGSSWAGEDEALRPMSGADLLFLIFVLVSLVLLMWIR